MSRKIPPPSRLPSVPLITGESAEQFERLRRDADRQFKPNGALQELLVEDFLYDCLDVSRARRAKAGLLNYEFYSALKSVLESLADDDNEEMREAYAELAYEWFHSKAAKKKVARLLGELALDLSAVDAEILGREAVTSAVEIAERLLSSAQARRYNSFQLLKEFSELAQKKAERDDRTIDAEALPAVDSPPAGELEMSDSVEPTRRESPSTIALGAAESSVCLPESKFDSARTAASPEND